MPATIRACYDAGHAAGTRAFKLVEDAKAKDAANARQDGNDAAAASTT